MTDSNPSEFESAGASGVDSEFGRLALDDGGFLAYRRRVADGNGRFPTVVFLGGFKSDMTGGKASALDQFCYGRGLTFLRFDYSGHGQSGGDFLDGSISRWTADALAAIDH